MRFAIEPATPEDLSPMALLLGQLFEQEADFHPDAAAQLRGFSRSTPTRNVGSFGWRELNQALPAGLS